MKLYRGQKNSDVLEMNDPEKEKGSRIGKGYFFTTDIERAKLFGSHILEIDVPKDKVMSEVQYDTLKQMATKRMNEVNQSCCNYFPGNEYDMLEKMSIGYLEAFTRYTGRNAIQIKDDEYVYYPMKKFEITVDLFSIYPVIEAISIENAVEKIKNDLDKHRIDWNEYIKSWSIDINEVHEIEEDVMKTYVIQFTYVDDYQKTIDDETSFDAYSINEAVRLAKDLFDENGFKDAEITNISIYNYDKDADI